MEPSARTVGYLLADARLPSGGHAHSGGMEPALVGGLPTDRILDYLIGRARTTGIVEAGTAVAAARAMGDTSGGDGMDPGQLDGLAGVAAAWAARTPSKVQRDAARALGRGYRRLLGRLWPRLAGGLPDDHPRAVLLGVIAAATGLPVDDLARLSVYDDVQTAVSALLKLHPMDPLAGAGWVLEACAAAEDLITVAASVDSPEAIPAFGAPQAEGWAEAHALLTRRLFRA